MDHQGSPSRSFNASNTPCLSCLRAFAHTVPPPHLVRSFLIALTYTSELSRPLCKHHHLTMSFLIPYLKLLPSSVPCFSFQTEPRTARCPSCPCSPPAPFTRQGLGSLTGDLLMGESQDPQGLQRLLEELSLLARRGRRPVGQEAVVGEGLQEQVSCRGDGRGQGQA